MLRKFLAQNIQTIEGEQKTCLANSQQRYVRITALVAIQGIIVQQHEQFSQTSRPTR